jgi:hypothetical protein
MLLLVRRYAARFWLNKRLFNEVLETVQSRVQFWYGHVHLDVQPLCLP